MDRDRELQKTLDVIRRKRDYIFSRYLPDPTNGYRPRDIKNVLVVISASRSGSSPSTRSGPVTAPASGPRQGAARCPT